MITTPASVRSLRVIRPPAKLCRTGVDPRSCRTGAGLFLPSESRSVPAVQAQAIAPVERRRHSLMLDGCCASQGRNGRFGMTDSSGGHAGSSDFSESKKPGRKTPGFCTVETALVFRAERLTKATLVCCVVRIAKAAPTCCVCRITKAALI